jgi:drug/metabolite transporter (DMT)-like permease
MTKAAVPSPARRSAAVQAVAWMMLALASFSVIAIAGREAQRVVSTAELMFWRALIGFVILFVIHAATRGALRDLGSSLFGLHVVRSIVHYGAQYSWLYALPLIPLAQLFAVEFTAPLWVGILAPMILGERLTWPRVLAGLIGFAGVLVVVRPGAVTVSTGLLAGLASALGFALSMICTKRLTRADSPFKIIFWMHALQTIFGLIPMAQGYALPDGLTWFWIVIVAICGLTAHYGLAKAFSVADAILVAPLDFLRLPVIALIGGLLYLEPIDPWVLAGGAVIVVANLVNVRGERRP